MKKMKHMRIDETIHEALLDGRRGDLATLVRTVIHEVVTGARIVTPPVKKVRSRTGVWLEEKDISAVSKLAADHNMSFDMFVTQALREYLEERQPTT